MKSELMFHTLACFSVVGCHLNHNQYGRSGRSDCVNMICEIQILAARSLPSVLIAFLWEKPLSQDSCGHREAFVGKTSGHKAHRRRGSEQQRGRNKDVWRLQSMAHNCWLNEITSVQDECSGRWARTGRSLWGGWSPPVPLPLLGVMQVVFWGLDKSHIRLLMGLR